MRPKRPPTPFASHITGNPTQPPPPINPIYNNFHDSAIYMEDQQHRELTSADYTNKIRTLPLELLDRIRLFDNPKEADSPQWRYPYSRAVLECIGCHKMSGTFADFVQHARICTRRPFPNTLY